MALGDHLREFRTRMIISLVAILVMAVIGFHFYSDLFNYLNEPMKQIARKHGKTDLIEVNFNGVTQPLAMKFKISFWAGFILASPVWLWEIWAFLVPGLTKRERRVGAAFICAAVPLFAAGIFMGAKLFGSAVHMLLDSTPQGAANLPTASEYFNFVFRFILAFGCAFLLPVFLMALNTARILPARRMLRGWRVAIICIALFSAIMTPVGDPWTMFVMSAPLLVLYFGTVAVALLADRIRQRHDTKTRPDWMDVPDGQSSPL